MKLFISLMAPKQKRLTLQEFHSFVTEQQRRPTTRAAVRRSDKSRRGTGGRGGGRLSDRLKSRHDGRSSGESKRDRRKRLEKETAAGIVGGAPTTTVNLTSSEQFPSLNDDGDDYVQVLETGCWANGIQGIKDAVDLPDPVAERALRLKEEREHQRRGRSGWREHDVYYEDEDAYYEESERGGYYDRDGYWVDDRGRDWDRHYEDDRSDRGRTQVPVETEANSDEEDWDDVF